MTTNASVLDSDLQQVLKDLAVGAVGRAGLAEWLARHARRLARGNSAERGVIGDLYAALNNSEELHSDRYVRGTAFAILEQLGLPQLWEPLVPDRSTSTLMVQIRETAGDELPVLETGDSTETMDRVVMLV